MNGPWIHMGRAKSRALDVDVPYLLAVLCSTSSYTYLYFSKSLPTQHAIRVRYPVERSSGDPARLGWHSQENAGHWRHETDHD